MFRDLVSFVVLLLSTVAVAQSDASPKLVGAIVGTVVDETGSPLAGAQVNAALRTLVIQKRIVFVDCDEHGSFVFPVWEFGTYSISAKKDDAGYAETRFFYPDKVPAVEVSRENPYPRIVVNVGPKAAVLIGAVRDAVSGRPLSSGFNLHWVNQPKRFYSTSETPSFRLLIPPLQDITLDVTAPGYKTWVYTAQPALRLEPGARMQLNVVLEPSDDESAGHLKYLVPKGYSGWVRIQFNVQGGAPAVSERGVTVLQIPSSGQLSTSSPVPEVGAREEYLFLSPDGSTHPIPNDYWNDDGMVWGEHEVTRGGHRGEIDFFVGTEEQFLERIPMSERSFWVLEKN